MHIDGLKMSKSLKNFITIKEILKYYTPTQLRLLIASHKYDQMMDFYPHILENGQVIDYRSMKDCIEKDARFKQFFLRLQAVCRRYNLSTF